MDNEKVKIYAGVIIMAITSITSVTTAFVANSKADKANQEDTAKAAYKELSAAVEQLSRNQVVISKDVASLRGYLAGMHQRSIPDDDDMPVSSKPKVTRPRSSASLPAGAGTSVMPPTMGATPTEYVSPDINDIDPD